MRISIINGPNLNLIGKRQPEIYGEQNLEEYLLQLEQEFSSAKLWIGQSNVEGELIDMLQEKSSNSDFIILNAGAYTHTSLAISDAVAAISCPVIEVHISNIAARSEHRHVSLLGKHCIGSISGFGLNSYKLALLYVMNCL